MPSSIDKTTSRDRKSQPRPQFDWLALQHALQFYQANHLCCVPVPFGGKKYNFHHAGNQGWEGFQKERPPPRQIDQWFKEDTPTNIAVVCGGVSNGLVALCFNDPNGAELFFGKERWEKLLLATFIVQTSRGHHVYLRSSIKIVSQDFTKDGQECWLEIRSDGRYIMAPPSKHPSGPVYKNIGTEKIHRPKDLPGFITKRLSKLGLKAFKASEKAKPPLTEQDKKVEGLLRKDLTLDQIAKEIGVNMGQVLTSLDHIDLPRLFSEMKGGSTTIPPDDNITPYRLLNVNKLTPTQAREKCEEIYAEVKARFKAEHTEKDDTLAVKKLLENCAFIQHCRDDAAGLSEPHWWSMVSILVVFGGTGRAKIHELSRSYPGYTEKETEQKIEEALKAGSKAIGPHTCSFIETELGFACPGECQAKKLGMKSPTGLAAKLAGGKAFKLTDLGNAERLVNRHGANIHYSEERKKWLIWTDKCWEWDYGSKVMLLAKETTRNILREAADENDDTQRKELIKHAVRSEGEARLTAMITLAQSEPGVTVKDSELNSSPWLFNCSNGTLNLKTGKLLPHKREDLLTIISPVNYDPDAPHLLWSKFLDRVTGGSKELSKYLQRAVGYSLTGDMRAQVMFFLFGLGNNGKSTFVSVIRKIMAGYGAKAPVDMFLAKDKNARGPSEGLANLQGKRFIAASEVESGRKLAVVIIKEMTGGESIRADRKYEHEIEFSPTHKLWISGNHKPVIADTSLAIWRRIKLIPFTVTIPNEEIDEDLPFKLEAELSGILAWAVEGCLIWQQSGLSEPREVTAATLAYRSEEDILAEFIQDCCNLRVTATVPKADLRERYKQWCEATNNQPVSQKTFKNRLMERGITEGKIKSIRFWRGIELLEGGGQEGQGGQEMTFFQESPIREDSLRKVSGKRVGNVPPVPDYPTKNCPACGGNEFYLTKDGRYLCSHCHPEPGGIDMEV